MVLRVRAGSSQKEWCRWIVCDTITELTSPSRTIVMEIELMTRIASVCFALFTIHLGSAAVGVAAELSWNEQQQLSKKLCPPADEPWRTIPWKISLLAGQKAAVESKKPIFIWAMDGHPLGCT